jgi:2-methylisocitrate lyase-like PEP mutase family enzyme
MATQDQRARFADLHRQGTFVLPNAWDIASARLLEKLGFEALATTSAGFAWTLGKEDNQVTLPELLDHVEALARATALPLSVDSQRCYSEELSGVAETVRLLAEAGAAGCSIEDFRPSDEGIDATTAAAERVGAAAEEGHRHGLVVTARAENHLYGKDDLTDTIDRLRAYRAAGADVVYAPGLSSEADIAQVVAAVDAPVNVLALPAAPAFDALAALGVRRISTGSLLASAAYGALIEASLELRDEGTATTMARLHATHARVRTGHS